MSNGDYEGLGSTRAEELRKSCALLGISEGRVHVVDDPGLQDGPLNHWDAEHIAGRRVEIVLPPRRRVRFS